MRALPLGFLALATAAHADPLLALGVHHAAVPAGSDHGEWNGVDLAIERAPLARTTLRLDLALDQIAMHSDEASFAYAGHQAMALVGVRVDLVAPADRAVRPYYAAGLGAGYLTTTPAHETARLYLEPVRLGLDIAVVPQAALRLETALIVHPTEYDPLALSIGAGVAFRL